MTQIFDKTTPAADGFRMPAEFERHWGCWMLWPERPDVWRAGGKPAQSAFAMVAQAIAETEHVTVGVSRSQFDNARARLDSRIRLIEVSYDDAWARDNGPTFIVNEKGEVRGVDWTFNAWGGLERGLYFPWDQDDKLARKIMEIERIDGYRSDLICEGGALLVDGVGTIVVTEPTILGTGKNAQMSRPEAAAVLNDYLGGHKVIWLPRGAPLDETGGHVDVVCMFAEPGHVLLSWPEDGSSEQARVAQEIFEVLRSEPDARGKEIAITKVPEPDPSTITAEEADSIDRKPGSFPRRAGDPVHQSYLNAYIANEAIILPVFDHPLDDVASKIFRKAFPGRAIKPVYSREIAMGGGNIHCITQQVPMSRTQPWLGARGASA